MASRMTRGSSLSDERIINLINEKFVAVNLNLSDHNFPKDLKCLAPWQKALSQIREQSPPRERGFSTTVILSGDGEEIISTSGTGYHTRFREALNYKPQDYLDFLKQALKRARDLQIYRNQANRKDPKNLKALKELQLLIEKEVKERNKGYQE